MTKNILRSIFALFALIGLVYVSALIYMNLGTQLPINDDHWGGDHRCDSEVHVSEKSIDNTLEVRQVIIDCPSENVEHVLKVGKFKNGEIVSISTLPIYARRVKEGMNPKPFEIEILLNEKIHIVHDQDFSIPNGDMHGYIISSSIKGENKNRKIGVTH
jgi:hypothetical protein